MTDAQPTSTRLTDYLDELSEALELRDAPSETVDDVVRQVASHVHDTGEDPYEAVGAPNHYAREFAPRGLGRFWALVGASVVLTVVGGWLFCTGVIDLVAGPDAARWSHPWVATVGGLVLVLGWVVLVVGAALRQARRRV